MEKEVEKLDIMNLKKCLLHKFQTRYLNRQYNIHEIPKKKWCGNTIHESFEVFEETSDVTNKKLHLFDTKYLQIHTV